MPLQAEYVRFVQHIRAVGYRQDIGGGSSQERTVLPDRQGRYREMLRDGERREGG
jgi:hypothetical protein